MAIVGAEKDSFTQQVWRIALPDLPGDVELELHQPLPAVDAEPGFAVPLRCTRVALQCWAEARRRPPLSERTSRSCGNSVG